MIGMAKILPGTGRGTIRRMVEGHPRLLLTHEVLRFRPCPSTPALPEGQFIPSGRPAGQPRGAAVPLPVPGRI